MNFCRRVFKEKLGFLNAVLMFLLVSSLVMSFPIAQASSEESLYITATVTEPVTTVGQIPKVVFTYGNRGHHTIKAVDIQCFNLGAILRQLNNPSVRRTLIPGQNANSEIDYEAVNTGAIIFLCWINGTDAVTNKPVSTAYTPIFYIQVK